MSKKSTSWLYVLEPQMGMPRSYLFGTMHLVCAERYHWPPVLEDILAEVRTVYLETDITQGSGFSLQSLKSDWIGSLNEHQKSVLMTFNRTHWQIPESELVDKHPFYLLAQLQVDMFECHTMALDQELMYKALAMGKTLCSLESFDEHIQTIDKVSTVDYVNQMLYCIEHYSEIKDGMRALIDHYHNGQLEKIERLFEKWAWVMLPSTAERAFITDRNLRWLPVMEGAMKAGSTLFAVGAGHIMGDAGILSLLSDKNYIIEMI